MNISIWYTIINNNEFFKIGCGDKKSKSKNNFLNFIDNFNCVHYLNSRHAYLFSKKFKII